MLSLSFSHVRRVHATRAQAIAIARPLPTLRNMLAAVVQRFLQVIESVFASR